MSDSLIKDSIESVAWKTAQTICSLGITFVIQLILARLLMPEDFGLIAIVNVFMTLANTVIETSFSSAIIQKHSIAQKVLSSIFFLNLLLSIILYVLLFGIAPALSTFFGAQILVPVLRIQGLRIVISATHTVQQALMVRKMRFKALFFCNFVGIVFQAVSGISLALYGAGIWALVLSTCIGSFVTGFLIIIVEFWKPDLYCSIGLILESLSFSSKILATRVVKKVYYNLRVLMIGKVYNSEILGYFNKGFQFPSTVMTIVDGSINSVAFTHLSKLQYNEKAFVTSVRLYVRYTMFVCTPLMIGLISIAKPLVLLLLTERWIECIPFLQIICLSQMFIPLSIKTTALEALGKSNLSMKLNLTGILISVLIIFCLIPYSPILMTIGEVFSSILLHILITIVTAKNMPYSVKDQIRDAISGLFPALIMAGGIYLVDFIEFQDHYFIEIMIKMLIGIFLFIFISMITKNEVYFSMIDVVKKLFLRKSV